VRKGEAWKIVGAVAVILVSLFTIWYEWPPKLGLDLKGGIDVVLEAQDTPEHKITSDDMDKTKLAIERRVDKFGLAEAVVMREGERRIRVQLPDVANREEAMQIIGRTAMLIFKDPDGEIVITGGHLKDANAGYSGSTGGPSVSLQFNSQGAKLFEEATERLSKKPTPEERVISIYLDDELISAPAVKFGEPIRGGAAEITGIGTMEDAKQLALLLKTGALPVPIKVVSDSFVDPTLGQDAIIKSAKAGLLGFVLVLIFVLATYGILGGIADLALGAYLVILMGALMNFKATLTLPGIAGLVLSVGMAVDANVIIFERIKEEKTAGKRIKAAVDAGFSRALSAIWDSNITTLLTAGVLLAVGAGPIKGFAITLSVGILCSMFTAVFLTRLLLTWRVDKNPEKYESYFKV
jgi:preprotein translocase subunit SecD